MFTIFGIMLSGVLLGYLMRNKKISFVHKIITALIWALLLLLGIEVGANETIINNLHSIGLEAILITSGAVAGSILTSWLLWRTIRQSQTNKDQA